MNSRNVSDLKNKINTSTWHLVLLGAATYGIYPLMWLYKYQDTLTEETGIRFSSRVLLVWMAVCAGLSILLNLMFPVQIDEYGEVYGNSSGAEAFAGIAFLLSLAWVVLMIVWAFKARAALQQYALTQFRFDLKMNPAWTILFHVFYINYCINAMPQALAKHQIIHGKGNTPATEDTTSQS